MTLTLPMFHLFYVELASPTANPIKQSRRNHLGNTYYNYIQHIQIIIGKVLILS